MSQHELWSEVTVAQMSLKRQLCKKESSGRHREQEKFKWRCVSRVQNNGQNRAVCVNYLSGVKDLYLKKILMKLDKQLKRL